jgi:hypothetical protein
MGVNALDAAFAAIADCFIHQTARQQKPPRIQPPPPRATLPVSVIRAPLDH